MSDEQAKRFDRIVAILIQLQTKRIIRAQELAERFGVSTRTIYRDIKTLENCGVPIAGEAGTGYSIMEGYKLPPVMFTREEAASFIAAEKVMPHFTDKSLGSSFNSALAKIKSVLRWSEKDLIDILDSSMLVQRRNPAFAESVPNVLETLMNGIVNKKQVLVNYQSLEAESSAERTIEPVGVYHEHHFWYIVAYCHLRQDYRNFRSDRISYIRLLDNDFERIHQSLDYYLKKDCKQGQDLVRIRVDRKTAKYLKNSRTYYGFIEEIEQEDKIEMQFMTWTKDDYFARWYLSFGDKAEIIEPASLKESVRQLMDNIYKRLPDK